MSALASLFQGPVFESIGWALIHLTWQATLVAILLAAINSSFRPARASVRYLLSCSALFLIAVLPMITAYQHYRSVALTPPDASPALIATSTAADEGGLTTVSSVAIRGVVELWKESVYRALTTLVPWLLLAWGSGVLFFSARLVSAWIKARDLTRAGVEAAPAYAREAARRIARALGLNGNVSLLISSLVEVPSVIGYFKPVVLLPASCLSGLTIAQLETIIAHELAHVRRYDFAVNFVQTVVETLFFYHPAVWWVSAQIRTERENACDDMAVALCGDAKTYARALTLLEQLRPQPPQPTLAATGGCLLKRIKRLLSLDSQREQFSTRWLAGASMLAVAAIAAALLPFTLAAQANRIVPAAERAEFRMAAGSTIDVVADRSADAEQDGDAVRADAKADLDLEVASVDELEDISKLDELEQAELHAMSAELAAMETTGCDETKKAKKDEAERLRRRAEKIAGKMKEVGEHRGRARGTAFVDLSDIGEPELRRLADAGIDPSTAAALARAGIDAVSVEELAHLAHAGADARYIDQMMETFGELDVGELVHLRTLDVDAGYVAALARAGIRGLDAGEIAHMRAVGVTPRFVEEFRAHFGNLSNDDLVQLSAVGVTSRYLQDLADLGITRADADDVVQLKAMGVSRGWVESLRRAGLKRYSIDDLTDMRAHGVTAVEIQGYIRKFGRTPSADEIIDMRTRASEAGESRRQTASEEWRKQMRAAERERVRSLEEASRHRQQRKSR